MEMPKFPDNAPIYESWDKAAKRLLNVMYKHHQSWIFHEPVDPEKLQIPDYRDIVLNPMDFGTIKGRLNTNYYNRLQEFLNDMDLTFDNCIQYNGENSSVGKMAKSVREEFRKQYQALNLDFYLNRI